LRGITGFAVNGTEHNSFVRLAVQYDRPVVCSQDERDNGKVFFTVNNNCGRGIPDRMLKRADQLVRDRAGRVFHLDTLTVDCCHPVARGSHGIPVDNGNSGGYPFFQEIVGDDVPYGIDIFSFDKGNNLVNGSVQYTERFLEEPAVLFGEYEHQRTFNA
jgi:hypothetical protein